MPPPPSMYSGHPQQQQVISSYATMPRKQVYLPHLQQQQPSPSVSQQGDPSRAHTASYIQSLGKEKSLIFCSLVLCCITS